MRRALAVALLAALAEGQQAPEPPLVPPDLVTPGPLEIAPREGDAAAALAAFREAHETHKRGDLDGALAGYLRFLGMPGRHELPSRYVATVEARVKSLLAEVRRLYDTAVARYGKDRRGGLGDLEALARRYPDLPEGRAALALVHSDGLRAAIDAARAAAAAGRKEEAAKALAEAVRAFPAALYRYEAKALVLDLGGPDLFDPGERVGGAKGEGDEATPEKERKEDESGIEVSDD